MARSGSKKHKAHPRTLTAPPNSASESAASSESKSTSSSEYVTPSSSPLHFSSSGANKQEPECRPCTSKSVVAALDIGEDLKQKGFERREYQLELVEIALRENVIICLPTGCGKTFIALQVILRTMAKFHGIKKVVFLAPTRPLVHQQAQFLKQNLPQGITVYALTGDLNVENWDGKVWAKILAESDILVMTTAILTNAECHGFCSWDLISLLVLDECHHSTGNDPLVELMKSYRKNRTRGVEVPKVLGLTATIVNGMTNVAHLATEIQRIQYNLCSRAVTFWDWQQVLKNSTNAGIEYVTYASENTEEDPLLENLNKTLEVVLGPHNGGSPTKKNQNQMRSVQHHTLTHVSQLYGKKTCIRAELRKVLVDIRNIYVELGHYCAKLAAGIKRLTIFKLLRESNMTELDLTVVRVVDTALSVFSTLLVNTMKHTFQHQMEEVNPEKFYVRNFITSKVGHLLRILEENRKIKNAGEDEKTLCSIVFTNERFTAQVINFYLQDLAAADETYAFLKTDFVLGGNRYQNFDELRYASARQANTIAKFKSKELNLLVATSVLEEGLDVPSCNLVVRFDGVATYPSFIQSMGRARDEGAKFYIFISSEKHAIEVEKMTEFQEFNKRLAQTLATKIDCVGDDLDFEVDALDDVIPDFCPFGPTGKRITQISAIHLVYNYCQKLRSGENVVSLPISWACPLTEPEYKGMVKAYMLLPKKAAVNDEIEGPPMPNKILAKRAVFMRACELLFAKGELDDNLVPRDKSFINFECDYLKDLAKEFVNDEALFPGKVGCRKRSRWFKKSAALDVSHPIVPGGNAKGYAINLTFVAFPGINFDSYTVEFEKHPYQFVIITNTKMNEVSDFFLKLNQGYVIVSLEEVKGGYFLTEEHLLSLQAFQEFMLKESFKIPFSNIFIPAIPMTMLIAPIKKDGTIDFPLVEKLCLFEHQKEELMTPPSQEERLFTDHNMDHYFDAIVVPWYKLSGILELQYVNRIECDLKKIKLFYGNTEGSDERQLKKSINYPNLPLLCTSPINKNRNFLFSVNTNRKDPNQEVVINAKEKQYLYLHPELVKVAPIPASILLQGRFLPSIIHRVNRLLVALEVKKSVADCLRFNWNVREDKHAYVRQLLNNNRQNEGTNPSRCSASGSRPEPVPSTSRAALKTSSSTKLPEPAQSVDQIDLNNLDFVHPKFLGQVLSLKPKAKASSKGKNRFILPSPENDEDVTKGLIDCEKLKFESFDRKTDFSVERGPPSHVIMEAFTLLGANDIINLERLEVMGDSCLKLIVSSHLYSNFPNWDEGEMTRLRQKFISNEHLYRLGMNRNFGPILSGCIFRPESFLPPGFTIPQHLQDLVVEYDTDYECLKTLSEVQLDPDNKLFLRKHMADALLNDSLSTKNLRNTSYTHSKISDKDIADAVEALIGAYYMHGGLDSVFFVMYWLGMEGPLHDMNSTPYSRDLTFKPLPDFCCYNGDENPHELLPTMASLERVLGYTFEDKWTIVEAMTHSSFLKNRVTPSYERLEFIGDAVLDFLLTDYIIKFVGRRDPGQVTDLRSALVNNITFGCLTLKYKLHNHLLHNSIDLHHKISTLSERRKSCDFSEETEMYTVSKQGGEVVVENLEIPKELGDIFESIIGAIYIDSKFQLDTVWRTVYRLMQDKIDKFAKNIPKVPLRCLHEKYTHHVAMEDYPQKESCTDKKFVRTSILGTDISVVGSGSTKQHAKQAAAKYILSKYP